jgi:hypothetical protein
VAVSGGEEERCGCGKTAPALPDTAAAVPTLFSVVTDLFLSYYRFKEMCRAAHEKGASATSALSYLQTRVSLAVSPDDAPDFERLSALLFKPPSTLDEWTTSGGGVGEERVRVYEEIAKHFGDEKRPPIARLQDYLLN